MTSMDLKYKRWIFLSSYALVMTFGMFKMFTGEGKKAMYPALSIIVVNLSDISRAIFCAVCFVLFLSMSERKIYWSRNVKVFVRGVFLWIVWAALIHFGGLTLFHPAGGTKRLFIMASFTAALVMSTKIAEVYHVKRQLTGITAFALGLTLLTAYIMNFNGLDFLPSLSRILEREGRYRFAFGLGHVNTAGRLSLQFFIFSAIYRALLEEERINDGIPGRTSEDFKPDALCKFFYLMYPIVSIILLSTASRTSISALVGFFLVYYFLGNYRKLRWTTKAMLLTVIFFVCYVLVISIDWRTRWNIFVVYSNRAANYDVLKVMNMRSSWLAGVGLAFAGFDSFYLKILAESGLVGFLILIGTIIIFSMRYFTNTKCMTRIHVMTGGLLCVVLYFGLFESFIFGTSFRELMMWLLLFTADNEKNIALKRQHQYSEIASMKS